MPIHSDKKYALTIFGFLLSFLVGIWGGILRFEGYMDKWLFAFVLMAALAFGCLYLAKHLSLWSNIFAIHNLWNKRIIVLSGIFSLLAVFYLFGFPNFILGLITLFLGFLLLFAIDRRPSLARQNTKGLLHSSQVVLGGLLFFGLATEFYAVFYFILGLKLFLFILRSLRLAYWKDRNMKVWSALRIFFLLWGFLIEVKSLIPLIIWIFIFLSEFIDRLSYAMKRQI